MAYIIKRKSPQGKHYVYLIESYRKKGKVKNRTLMSYGSYDELEANEPGAFERLRQEAKDGLIGREVPKQLIVQYNSDKEISSNFKKIGWKLFESIFEVLKIKDAIASTIDNIKKTEETYNVLRLLTYQRILDPGSKLYTYGSQKDLFGDWNIDENKIYRTLSKISESKERIQINAHQQVTKHIGRIATLVFYDVTNYYFETDFNDEDLVNEKTGEIIEALRKRGPCKAKSGKPIVQLGLFMDSNGIPICYKLFRGNLVDSKTYLPAIELVKKQFGIERIIIIADKGLNTKNNISETYLNDDGWLFSQKHRGTRGVNKQIQEFILDDNDWQFNLTETFAKKSMIRGRELNNGVIVKEKVVVTWSQKYAIREQKRRDGALDYAEKLTNAELFRQTSKKGGKKYLDLFYLDKETGEKKPYTPIIEINREKANFDSLFDGINVLVTSEIKMSDDEIIESYGELYKIEDCFKVTKTEFDARPVYVRLTEHIEAHFLTCFLSLLVIRIIQHKTKWKYSPKKLIEAINSAKALEVQTGFYLVEANENFKDLLKLLNIDFHNQIQRYEDIKNLRISEYTTK